MIEWAWFAIDVVRAEDSTCSAGATGTDFATPNQVCPVEVLGKSCARDAKLHGIPDSCANIAKTSVGELTSEGFIRRLRRH